MSNERIPEDVLAFARLRMKRKVASMLIAAMAETGASFALIDARVGWPAGFSRRYLLKLIDGSTKDLNMFSDLCTALDIDPVFSCSFPQKPTTDLEASQP